MATHAVRARDKDTLAQFLGWFSIGLGSAQLAAPRPLCRAIGASADGSAPRVMRLMGARELVQGVGILARPRPTAWVWSRVAGDALDLSLLGLVAVRAETAGQRARTLVAIANVAAVTVPDVLESRHLARKSGLVRSGRPIRKTVTLNLPRHEVEQAYATATELRRKLDDSGAAVTFADAPGDRGTELVVEFRHDPPLGDLGAAAQKLTGRDLATQLADELRRFKQQVETGHVVRSNATPDGHRLAEHLKQRAARPLEAKIS